MIPRCDWIAILALLVAYAIAHPDTMVCKVYKGKVRDCVQYNAQAERWQKVKVMR